MQRTVPKATLYLTVDITVLKYRRINRSWRLLNVSIIYFQRTFLIRLREWNIANLQEQMVYPPENQK